MFANSYTAPVQEFGPDEFGEGLARGMFRDIWARVQARMGQAAWLGFDGDPVSTLGGYAQSPQNFQGAASRATTLVVGRDGGYPTISSGITEGPTGDPARRIFAARLQRGRL
jgi:hypothetical protein